MRPAPKSFRLHIGLFGRRNAGKSSLLNAACRQQVSIVAETAGTTTDPVEKPMELLPIGPVLFIDTAGIDDVGALGEKRVAKTRQVFDRTDLGLLVVDAGQWGKFEDLILQELSQRKIPAVVVFNKSDLGQPDTAVIEKLEASHVRWVETVATTGQGVLPLREALVATAPEDFLNGNSPSIISDLVRPGELVVLVVPIDKEAPKGRLIQPQVETIRDLLDGDSYAMVVKERELRDALDRLKRPPALVVTDSQAFLKVAADTPPEVKMTSFSILFARQKGDLSQFVQGALAIERLRAEGAGFRVQGSEEGERQKAEGGQRVQGSAFSVHDSHPSTLDPQPSTLNPQPPRVLVAEACSHHPITDDIGRVKIPRWLRQYVGREIHFDVVQGHDFPDDLSGYQLVIHCGACMWNRREMLTRLLRCRQAGVPVCNYGMTIAYTLGILDRALEPFPDALETYRRLRADLAPGRGRTSEVS